MGLGGFSSDLTWLDFASGSKKSQATFIKRRFSGGILQSDLQYFERDDAYEVHDLEISYSRDIPDLLLLNIRFTTSFRILQKSTLSQIRKADIKARLSKNRALFEDRLSQYILRNQVDVCCIKETRYQSRTKSPGQFRK